MLQEERGMKAWGVGLLAAGLVLATGGLAHAQAGVLPIDVGVGAVGYVGGSFLDEPDDKVVTAGNARFEAVYPGFAGVGGGGGLLVDARAFGIVGLETGLFYTNDQGSGEVNDINVTIKQTSLHIPLLLKLSLPTPVVSANIFGGLEFVIPQDTSVEQEQPVFGSDDRVKAEAEAYTLASFGLGFEFKLPIPTVDLRIPLAFRGGFNYGDTGKIEDRITYDTNITGNRAFITGATFNSEWQWHAAATLGLVYYFL
jgi:hypothetical protein